MQCETIRRVLKLLGHWATGRVAPFVALLACSQGEAHAMGGSEEKVGRPPALPGQEGTRKAQGAQFMLLIWQVGEEEGKIKFNRGFPLEVFRRQLELWQQSCWTGYRGPRKS